MSFRLKVGAHFFDQEGKQIALSVKKGETRILNKVFYMGKVCVNVIGQWQEGLKEPLWVMTNLPAEQGFSFYEQRMKIEETFKDLKSLLGMDKLMCQKRRINIPSGMSVPGTSENFMASKGCGMGRGNSKEDFPNTGSRIRPFADVFT